MMLTRACGGQADLDQLRDEVAWLGAGVVEGQHPMRLWEYALAVRALQRWATERPVGHAPFPLRLLDVGGSGSLFGLTLQEKLGPFWEVELVDPKETTSLEARVGPAAQAIFSISTIEHVADPLVFLAAIAANLQPGGLAFLTMDGKGTEGPDTQHFSWMRERIYTPYTWAVLISEARALGLHNWGLVDLEYRGDHVFDYSFFSLCLRKA